MQEVVSVKKGNDTVKYVILGSGILGAVVVGYYASKKAYDLNELKNSVLVKTSLSLKHSIFTKSGLVIVPTASITNPTPTEIIVRKPTVYLGYSLDGGKTIESASNSPISPLKKTIKGYGDTDFGEFPLVISWGTLGLIALKRLGFAINLLKKAKEIYAFIVAGAKQKTTESGSTSNQVYDNIYDESRAENVAGFGWIEDVPFDFSESEDLLGADWIEDVPFDFEYGQSLVPFNAPSHNKQEGFGFSGLSGDSFSGDVNEKMKDFLSDMKKAGVSVYAKYDYDVYLAGKRVPIKSDWSKLI